MMSKSKSPAAEKVVLPAKVRPVSSKGSLGRMRREGNVPAVVYGLKTEPTMVVVKATDLRAPLAQRNLIFQLDIEGKIENVMLKTVERDPIRRDVTHVDFLRVNDTHPVVVTVPVTTFGIPVGVKQQGGVFSVMKKVVRLKTRIGDIPDQFKIDVSELGAGKIFYVRDLKIANGTFLTPPKTALFGVTSGRKEDEAAAAAAAKPAAAAPAAAAKSAEKAAPAAAKGGDKKK